MRGSTVIFSVGMSIPHYHNAFRLLNAYQVDADVLPAFRWNLKIRTIVHMDHKGIDKRSTSFIVIVLQPVIMIPWVCN